MFTAASVMMSAVSWPGTSMTKQWLTRRAVRRPPSRRTTAPMSSSVCRLPFISASAWPDFTSSTATSAVAWLCGASTMRIMETSLPSASAAAVILACGPTRMGSIGPSPAASNTAPRDAASHGCTTATFSLGSDCAAATSRSYLSCRRWPGSGSGEAGTTAVMRVSRCAAVYGEGWAKGLAGTQLGPEFATAQPVGGNEYGPPPRPVLDRLGHPIDSLGLPGGKCLGWSSCYDYPVWGPILACRFRIGMGTV